MAFPMPVFCDETGWSSQLPNTPSPFMLQNSPKSLPNISLPLSLPNLSLPNLSLANLSLLSPELALQPYRPLYPEMCMRPFSPAGFPPGYLSDYSQIFQHLNDERSAAAAVAAAAAPPPLQAPTPPMSSWLEIPPVDHMFRQQKASELFEQLQHLLQVQHQQAAQYDCDGTQLMDQSISTNAACASCYRSKLSCDKQRPCSRCLKGGRECMSRTPVKLGRPRKRDSFDATRAMRTSMFHPGSFQPHHHHSVSSGGSRERVHNGGHVRKHSRECCTSGDPSSAYSKLKDPDEFHRQTCDDIAGLDFGSLEISSSFDYRQQKPKVRRCPSPTKLSSRKRPARNSNNPNGEKRSNSISSLNNLSVKVGHGGVEFNLEGVVHDDSFFEVSDVEWYELQEQSSSVRFAVLLTCEIARVSENLIENCSRNYMIVWSLCSVLAKRTKKLDFVRLLMRVWSTAYQSVFPRLIWGNEEDESAQPDFHQLDNLSLTAALPSEIITLLDSRCVMASTVVLESAPEVTALPSAVLRMWDVSNQDETSVTTYVSYNQHFVQLFGYEGLEVVEIIQRSLFFEQVVLEEDWPILIKERVTSFANHTTNMSICVRIVTKPGTIVPVTISFYRLWAGDRVYLTYASIAPVNSSAAPPLPSLTLVPATSPMMAPATSHALVPVTTSLTLTTEEASPTMTPMPNLIITPPTDPAIVSSGGSSPAYIATAND